MNIVVLVLKQVPDTYSERKLRDDGVLDRDATDAVLDEINERAVEAALQLKEAAADSATAPRSPCSRWALDRATDAIRKALSMGADKAVHLSDDALAGSDAVSTAKVLAKAIGTVEGVDLVLAGNEASDGRGAAVPAMVADVLGVARDDARARAHRRGRRGDRRRETDDGVTVLPRSCVVVSVSEKINEPRYPSFKGIMAAKKKPVATLSLADGVDAGEVGLANALSTVTSASPKTAQERGREGQRRGRRWGQDRRFLVGQKLI